MLGKWIDQSSCRANKARKINMNTIFYCMLKPD